MSWQQYAKFYLEYCNNNDEFKKIINNPSPQFPFADANEWYKNQQNTCLKFSDNIDELKQVYSENKLITTRFGCVESSFIIKSAFDIGCNSHLDTNFDEPIDKFMKTNTGLYYKRSSDAKQICNWWVTNAIEILQKSVLTSCLCVLKFDLYLWSLFNIKGTFYNWGHLTKLILQNSGGKKILYVGSARNSVDKAFSRGVQMAWKFHIPKFDLYIQDTPQTTTGCEYPDMSIKETCAKILSNITQNYSDFDTAIFGCGAYGPPLMNELSKLYKNKNLLYLGSACYTLFGIYSHGIDIPDDYDVIKENWIPVEEKIEPHLRSIDDGKYWRKE